jgi:hypothetical protein
MEAISLDKYRGIKQEAEARRRRELHDKEVLRQNVTLAMRLAHADKTEEGPHFAWSFLDHQSISEILELVDLHSELLEKNRFVQDIGSYDYLIYYGMGDLAHSEEGTLIRDRLEEIEEGYAFIPLHWDGDDDDPSYRVSPIGASMVVTISGVKWRIPHPHKPGQWFETYPIPAQLFRELQEAVK